MHGSLCDLVVQRIKELSVPSAHISFMPPMQKEKEEEEILLTNTIREHQQTFSNLAHLLFRLELPHINNVK